MSTHAIHHDDCATTLSDSHLDAMAMFLRIAKRTAFYAPLRRELRQRYRGSAWRHISLAMEQRGIRL